MGPNWAAIVEPDTVIVSPGGDPAQATVTNTFTPTPAPAPPTVADEIERLYGSYSENLVYYPSPGDGDPGWRQTTLAWPCDFEGNRALEWREASTTNGVWCHDDNGLKLRLGARADVDGSIGPWPIFWPAEGEEGFYVLRPGMALEVAFVPYVAAPFGMVAKDVKNGVTYQFMYQPRDEGGKWFIQLKEGANEIEPQNPPEDIELYVQRDYSYQYRLRIELRRIGRYETDLVFKWKPGLQADWSTFGTIKRKDGDDSYSLGLIIEGVPRSHESGYSSIPIAEAKLEWSSPPKRDSDGILDRETVDNAPPGFEKIEGGFEWNPPDLASDRDMDFCENPDYTQRDKQPNSARWCGKLPNAGYYDVEAFIPNSMLTINQTAVYEIKHANGTAKVSVNQQDHKGKWVYLGTYEFDGSTACVGLVALTMVNETSYTVYDRVRWTRYDSEH